jgi:hypothetical protein
MAKKIKVSKKAGKQLKKTIGKPVSKRYGKAVMIQDPKNPNRKIGYKTTKKTTLPPSKKRKVGKGASMQAKKSYRKLK